MAKSSYESIAGYLVMIIVNFVLYWLIMRRVTSTLQFADELASALFAIDTLYILYIVLLLFARAIANAYLLRRIFRFPRNT